MQHLNKRLSPQSLQNHSGAGETPRGEVLRFEISRGRSDCAGAVFVLFFDLAVTSVLHVLASIVAPSCGCLGVARTVGTGQPMSAALTVSWVC